MDGPVDAGGSQGRVDPGGQQVDPAFQKLLEKGADHVEGQHEDQGHDPDKAGDRRVFSGKDPVEAHRAFLFAAHPGLHHRRVADLLDKCEAHLRDRSGPVQSPLRFHLQHDVLQHLELVLIERQLLQDLAVALDGLAGSELHRKIRPERVILDQVPHRVNAPVHGSAVVMFPAEVLPERSLLVFCQMDRVLRDLLDALVLHRGDRDDRHAEQRLHAVDIDGPAVSADLVHHIEGHHHGHVHFQQLHRQIQVPLDIRGVHDINDRLRLLLQHEIAGDDLLAAVG